MSFSIGGFFHSAGNALHTFFTKTDGAIQTVLADASVAANVAASVAAISLSPEQATPVLAEIAKVTDGLAIVQKGVTAESTAGDLTAHAQNLAGIVTSLVSSGDLNIKNAQLQASIGVAATKVQSVVGVLENAATVAPVK
jgi:hypothetical protein